MDGIEKLTDAAAIGVLEAVARGQGHGQTADTRQASSLAAAWKETAGQEPAEAQPASEGDLARAALQWLSADAQSRTAITRMMDGPRPESFGVVGTGLGVIAAVLLLLKLKGVVEYKDGKWHFKVELVELKEGPLKIVFENLSRLIQLPGSK